MLQALKQAVKALAPVTYDRARRAYNYHKRFTPEERREHRQATERFARLITRIAAQSDWRVQSGPFAGMKYPATAGRQQWRGHLLGSALAPKILGSYEAELQQTIREISTTSYSTVIDIGTGEGYYAVGLARLIPTASVLGFEINANAREYCRRMAALNNVGRRVKVGAAADAQTLASALEQGKCLVVCDCEGCEETLLNPIQVPALASADILVELHDFLVPGITDVIRERFAPTHDIELIQEGSRDPSTYATLAALQESDQHLLLDETRPAIMSWAWLRTRCQV